MTFFYGLAIDYTQEDVIHLKYIIPVCCGTNKHCAFWKLQQQRKGGDLIGLTASFVCITQGERESCLGIVLSPYAHIQIPKPFYLFI